MLRIRSRNHQLKGVESAKCSFQARISWDVAPLRLAPVRPGVIRLEGGQGLGRWRAWRLFIQRQWTLRSSQIHLRQTTNQAGIGHQRRLDSTTPKKGGKKNVNTNVAWALEATLARHRAPPCALTFSTFPFGLANNSCPPPNGGLLSVR